MGKSDRQLLSQLADWLEIHETKLDDVQIITTGGGLILGSKNLLKYEDSPSFFCLILPTGDPARG